MRTIALVLGVVTSVLWLAAAVLLPGGVGAFVAATVLFAWPARAAE